MKKLLSLLLALMTLVTLLSSCAKTVTTEEQPSSPESEEPTGYVDQYEDHDDLSDVPVKIEHVMLDEVPSSFSLIGTTHLPPIDNQGGIGSCASEAITYMQFTNAVSRYLHSVDEKTRWDPSSGNERYIFAPKFTYNYSGAGTAWVYDILKDHGCQVLKDCQFFMSGSYKYGTSKNNRQAKSIEWQLGENDLKSALDYRIKDYEQIWMNTIDYSLTTSEKGQDLLYKIKDAVAQGNVVVTGGFSSNWQYAQITEEEAAKSTLAKPGDWVCYWCNGLGGGHQVSIVGYDDDFEYTCNGVTLKGAFQVANSWGDYWKNDGFFWVSYDSVNKISEFEEMNALPGREPSMDQFCFIYWDKDIVVGKPTAYVSVELSANDRESFYIELTRTDATDNSVTHVPALFDYGNNFKRIHTSDMYLNNGEAYITFSGNAGGKAETGIFTLGYNPLEIEGKGFDDYLWGVNICTASMSVTVHSVKLYDGSGKLRSEIIPSEDIKKVKPQSRLSYVFDMGNELSKFHDVGSYKLKNVHSGLYVTPHVLLLESGASVLDAVTFDVTFDLVNRVHEIFIGGDIYLLDIQGKKITDGTAVKFNARSSVRNTQTWKVVMLEDGTYNIRLAADTRYAMGMVNGEIVLVSGEGIRDYGAWVFENAGSENMIATARMVDGALTVSGRMPKDYAGDTMTVNAYKADGTLAKTFEAKGEGDTRSFSFKVEGLEAGTYAFAFLGEKNALLSSCYVVNVE